MQLRIFVSLIMSLLYEAITNMYKLQSFFNYFREFIRQILNAYVHNFSDAKLKRH